MNRYDPKAKYSAEMYFPKSGGAKEFRIEKCFETLEEAKTWVKKNLKKTTLRWFIDDDFGMILSGE